MIAKRKIAHVAAVVMASVLTAGTPTRSAAQAFTDQIGQQMQDAVLITKVSMRVQYHRDLLLEKVEIAAHGGVVTLSGKISNQPAIDTAVKLASQVGGVKQVVNQMTIGRREPDHAVITSP